MSHKSEIKPILETEFDDVRIDLMIRAKMNGVDLSKIRITNADAKANEKAMRSRQVKAMFVN